MIETVAGVTGLEPATSGVTGRHSNQLSYTPAGGVLADRSVDQRQRESREIRHDRDPVKRPVGAAVRNLQRLGGSCPQ